MKNVIKTFGTIALLGANYLSAQTGIIRGKVVDETTSKAIKGATVSISELTKTNTDLDGKFELTVPVGIHTLTADFEAYNSVSISEIQVNENQIFVIENDIKLSPAVEGIGQVKVSVKRLSNTEEALLSAKKIAPNMIDGISSAGFKRIGDGDAASAMSRVTGVSVEGGKYVYVRGLGDRYTKTTLNGMDIPGLDPDRNTIQMDLFPTSVIDNIVVSKTFTADLPADFTGGVVDIGTKDFPDKKNWNFSVGLGYNPDMNFKSNYLTYKGSGTDFLGFDNGQRNIPTQGVDKIPTYTDFIGSPNGAKGTEFQRITRAFNPTMGPTQKTSLMNVNLGVSYSNTRKISKRYSLGYQASMTYRNETELYEDAEYNMYAKDINYEVTELTPLERQKGNFGTNNVLLGALGTVAIKSENNKVKLNLLHIQNGESKAGEFIFLNTNLGATFEAKQYNLDYNQRSLTNMLIAGTHSRNKGKWQIDWKISPTRSAIKDPDVRFTRFRIPDNNIGTEVGKPERIWRNLVEYNISNRIDVARNYRLMGKKAHLKFGAAYTFKHRDFNIRNFQITVGNIKFTGDPNEIFNEQNLVSSTQPNGVRYDAMFIPNNPNEFKAMVNHTSVYGSNDWQLSPQLKAVVGLRAEHYLQQYTGISQTKNPLTGRPFELDNEAVMNDLNLFPTANMMYNISKKANLRISYARTIARPSLKELSYAEILDPITGRTFIGGKYTENTNINGQDIQLWDGNLKSTNINNFDIRWEQFEKGGDMISAGVFFKTLRNPIEIVQFLADAGSFQPRNVGNATILGLELEMRKNLEVISSSLKNFSFNTNLTLTDSRISITETEFLSRDLTKRKGQTIERTRDMAGQAPYIVNIGLSHMTKDKSFESGLFYNVQGPTLQFVGFNNKTDVYSVPFHSLNFNATYKFGEKDRMNLGFKVTNILNDKREQIFTGFNATDQFFTRLSPGRNFQLKFSYAL